MFNSDMDFSDYGKLKKLHRMLTESTCLFRNFGGGPEQEAMLGIVKILLKENINCKPTRIKRAEARSLLRNS